MKTLQAINIINTDTEVHYAERDDVDAAFYPHTHDFYEIVLILEGLMNIDVNNEHINLPENTLSFCRPSDRHSRMIPNKCRYIVIDFPIHTFDALLNYLDISEDFLFKPEQKTLPVIYLTNHQRLQLEDKLKKLTAPSNPPAYTKILLRTFIADILVNYFYENSFFDNSNSNTPQWLTSLCKELSCPKNMVKGLEYIYENSPMTKEHISRSFKKYLFLTPTEYITSLRLEACIKLIATTDMPISQIAYEVGFNNLSLFYRNFKATFGTTPNKIKNEFSMLSTTPPYLNNRFKGVTFGSQVAKKNPIG